MNFSTLSVIIPCLNVARLLPVQLEALSRQKTERSWEVIIADNGSIDQTREIARSFAPKLPSIRIVDVPQKGRQHACNGGARAAEGELLVFVDGDDEVGEGFLRAMGRRLEECNLVGGRLEHKRLNPQSPGRFGMVQNQGLMPGPGFLPFVMGACMGVRREAFEKVGGFSEHMDFCEDVDLSWKIQQSGFDVCFEPEAVVHYRQRDTLSDMYRQHRNYGTATALLFRDYAAHGMPRRGAVEVGLSWIKLLWSLPRLRAADQRIRWIRRLGRTIGYLRGSLRYRVLYL